MMGVLPGRGLGKGHRQCWLKAGALLGNRKSWEKQLKVTVTKQSMCLCMRTQGRAGLPLPTPTERCCQNRLALAREAAGDSGDDLGTGTTGSQQRWCVCVCGGPQRAGWGTSLSLLQTCILFRSMLALPRGVGGDQTVCPCCFHDRL